MDTPVTVVNQDLWLQLGVAGAVLLILLVTILLIFKQQGTSIDKLCTKIDELVTNLSDSNLKLNEVIVTNDKDQKETLRQLEKVHKDITDIHKRIVRIDTRLFEALTKKD